MMFNRKGIDSRNKQQQYVYWFRRLCIILVLLCALTSLVKLQNTNFADYIRNNQFLRQTATVDDQITHSVESTFQKLRFNTDDMVTSASSSAVTSDSNTDDISIVHAKLHEMNLKPIYDVSTTTDPWKVELFQRLDRIRVACGKLCQLNTIEDIQQHTVQNDDDADVPFSMVQVQQINCPAIMNLKELDASDTTMPAIPIELYDYFTLSNAMNISDHERKSEIYLGTSSETSLWETDNVWTEEDINNAIRDVEYGTLKGSYGVEATNVFRDTVKHLPIQNKHLLVIGSSHPWVEITLLYLGAAKITTLEYGTIISEHPKINTLTPSQFRDLYNTGQLDMFDGIISHSSIEHSGLGRYGDSLNPWGDILTVARAWCVTKDDGFMYLGLPTGKRDMIMSNWHRMYSKIRWPLVTTNWKVIPPYPNNYKEIFNEYGIWKAQKNGGIGFLFQKVKSDHNPIVEI